MKKHLIALAALVAMTSANAGDLSYTYAEGGFGRMDLDAIDENGDGYFVGGSFGFAGNWLAFAEYGTFEFDAAGASADVDELQLGFGAHFPIADKVDFVGKLAYVDQSIDVSSQLGNASASEDGYLLSAGVRGQIAERLDLSGAIEYVDVGDADDTGLALRGVYDFTDMFSAGARIGYSDDATEYGLFARMRF